MMDQNNAIEVRDLKKKFKIYHDKGKMLKERAISISRNKYEEHWVLNGISFDVKKGEAVGLIGHNGCGKSTTLKLLTQIMYPTSGTVKIRGRVSSLLELGAGFHPDLSGRENIYINASIFGLTKKEIDRRVEDIIAFSELEEFIDNPVRTYSSGMYMRLAFSVAINVDADVLLIDEILAVGDVNFQAKCFNKMMDIKKNGTTIVIVSHSLGQIEQICERSIWIHDGLVHMDGKPKEVHEEYLKYMGEQRREKVECELAQKNEENRIIETQENVDVRTVENTEDSNVNNGKTKVNADANKAQSNEGKMIRVGTGEARFVSVKSYGSGGKEQYAFSVGDDICFKLKYKVNHPLDNAYFGLSIFRNDGIRCYGTNTKIDDIVGYNLRDDGMITLSFPNIQLLPGHYYVDVCIASGMDDFADYWSAINDFEVFSQVKDIGVAILKHEWK